MAAYTKAAIDAYIEKFNKLMNVLKTIPGFEYPLEDDFKILSLVGEGGYGAIKTDLLSNFCVVCGTVWSLFSWRAQAQKYRDIGFDAIIIDEGSQMAVGQACIPLSLFNTYLPQDWRVIIAGDHKQLDPVYMNRFPKHHSIPLFTSFLDCLLWNIRQMSEGSSAVQILEENFRMVPELCKFTEGIYIKEEQIIRRKCAFDPINREPRFVLREKIGIFLEKDNLHPSLRKLFEQMQRPSNSMFTVLLDKDGQGEKPFDIHVKREASVVGSIVSSIFSLHQGAKARPRVFVITPHHVQRICIRKTLIEEFEMKITSLENRKELRIDTVERMQGDEADYVVVCFGFTTCRQKYDSIHISSV